MLERYTIIYLLFWRYARAKALVIQGDEYEEDTNKCSSRGCLVVAEAVGARLSELSGLIYLKICGKT